MDTLPKTGAGFGFKAKATIIEKMTASEDEPRSFWGLNQEQLKESIRQNLDWLLNSRTHLTKEEFERQDLTVLDYGIPDFGAYAPASHEDQKRLERHIRRAVNAFEPRLRDVKVEIKPEMEDEKSLRAIIIHAIMAEASIREPVSFKTILQP
ncbi:MAG: hypothetical protein BWK80_42200 [Desulfobacteraceae bacterium IS3]|nr:MAG: hypothetical protein BWK80_42200 [Desulfobacteraceae bacterium IS3]HAO22756.1 type VI secretion system baseplate subunit TssE [Desulfobacteraceae bacterium]